MTRSPLIHIGYHKTGTTWLQERIFNNENLGFARAALPDIERAFIILNAFVFDPAVARSVFDDLLARAEGKAIAPVISHERLSGAPLAKSSDSRLIADRIAETFPDGRVLIVIREQRDLMLSLYKEYVYVRSGDQSFRRFWGRRVRQAADLPQLGLDVFEYHHLIEYYQRRFGPDRVLVLPYEQLRADPNGFVAKIASFVGSPVPGVVPSDREHASLPASGLAAIRWLNVVQARLGLSRLFEGRPENSLLLRARLKIVGFLGRLAPKGLSLRVDEGWRKIAFELTGDRFATGNRRMADITGLDLEGFGYDMARSPARVPPHGAEVG